MSNPEIKVAFCVAYDWEMLKVSLPLVYEHSDLICLGLDKDRHAWSCKPYKFDEDAFYTFVKAIDTHNKIIVYEDDFSLPDLDSRQNCNRHRHLMADKMGHGGWHLQIDADEYFLDFGGFVRELKKIDANPSPDKKPINICCPFVPLIKRTSTGYLYVDFDQNSPEIIPIATNKPDYQRARQNGHFNHFVPSYVIHETWARSEDELWFKINNWGHSAEELKVIQPRLSYFHLWKALDENNYQYIHNFHPAKAEVWPSLGHIQAEDIHKLLKQFTAPRAGFLNRLSFSINNNRNIARLKSIWSTLKQKIS